MPAGGEGYFHGDYWNSNYWNVNYWAGASGGGPSASVESISAVGLLGLSTTDTPAEVIKMIVFLIYLAL